MSSRYRVNVIDLDVCEGAVGTLRLSRPEGYSYAAGQWFRLTVSTDQGGSETKTFSHASSPADSWIEMTTRLSGSTFKNALAGLNAGDELEIMGPGGRLGLPEGSERIACLAGGVGITPIRSILRDALLSGRAFEDAVVFYGDRDESCMTYLAELQAMGAIGVRVVPVLEHPRATWDGPTGFITPELMSAHLDAIDDRPVLVAGPPVMVNAMSVVLDTLGVPAERRIVERFGTETQQTR